MLAIVSLLIPAVLSLYFAGGWLLGIIGTDYSANGFEVLRDMVLASFFVAVNSIYYSIKRIQKDVKGLVLLSGIVFVLLIGLSYPLMLQFGIVGLGYAWLISYGLSSFVIAGTAKKVGWNLKQNRT